MSRELLTREAIVDLLEQGGAELREQQVRGEIFLSGRGTARLVRRGGRLVADSDRVITQDEALAHRRHPPAGIVRAELG